MATWGVRLRTTGDGWECSFTPRAVAIQVRDQRNLTPLPAIQWGQGGDPPTLSLISSGGHYAAGNGETRRARPIPVNVRALAPEVRTWVRGAEGCGNVENSSTGPGLLAPDVWAASRAPDSYTREYKRRRRCPPSDRAGGEPRTGHCWFSGALPNGGLGNPLRPPYSSLM